MRMNSHDKNYLEVAESHVAGSTELQHASLDVLELLDGKTNGLDAVLILSTAPEDHNN